MMRAATKKGTFADIKDLKDGQWFRRKGKIYVVGQFRRGKATYLAEELLTRKVAFIVRAIPDLMSVHLVEPISKRKALLQLLLAMEDKKE